jgi:hypothetical protein
MPPAADPTCVLSAADMQLIAQIGFMACNARHGAAAYQIFEGLRELRPERTFPLIGLAMANLSTGKPEEAVRLLRDQALPAHPEDEELIVFLGLSLRAAKRMTESATVLNKLLASPGTDTPLRRLAHTLVSTPHVELPVLVGGATAAVQAKRASFSSPAKQV